MLRTPLTLDRDRRILILAAVGAIPCGLAVGLRPTGAVLLAAVAAGLITCAVLPIRHLPALALAVTIITPSLIFNGVTGSGQSRAIMLILVLALVRVLMARSRIAVPSVLPLALAAAVGATLMTALVASSRPASQVGTTSSLLRDLTLPLAAVIGLIGAAHARNSRAWLTIPRVFAWLGLVAALASVVYWAWQTLHVGVVSNSVFHQVAAASLFGKRSVFPFVEDSPNLGAVMFVLMCAFAAPPLLLAPGVRDRLLGTALAMCSLAAVLTTQSRTGLFAAGAGSLAYLMLVKRGGGRRSTLVVILVLFFSVGAYVFGTFPAERASGDTFRARTQIWGQAARAFLDDPIIGHGYNYGEQGHFVEAANDGAVSRYQSTHSDLLSHLVDGGVVGTAIFIAVLGVMLTLARRSVADSVYRPLGIGYCCMLSAMVVGGLDNTLSQSAAVTTVEWLAFGVMAGLVAHPEAPWLPHPAPPPLRVRMAGRAPNGRTRRPFDGQVA